MARLLIETDNCYSLSALSNAFGIRPSAMYVLLQKKNGVLDPFVKEMSFNGGRIFVLTQPIPEEVFRTVCPDSFLSCIVYHGSKG